MDKNKHTGLFQENSSKHLYKYTLVIFVFLSVSIFYFSITYDDLVAGFLSDDAVYLLMAEYYSPWKDRGLPVLDYLREYNHFPPLYPVLLGVFGVTTETPQLASTLTVIFLILTLVACGGWIWKESDSLLPSLFVPVVIAILPGTLIFSQELWSEFLFMFLLYSAFACLGDIKHITASHWLAGGLLIGLSGLARSAGISIIIAFNVLLFIKRPKRFLLYSAISIVPIIYWSLSSSGPVYGISYWDIILDQAKQSSGKNITVVSDEKIFILWESLKWNLSILPKSGIYNYIDNLFIFTLLVFCFIGLVNRIKRLKIDALFLFIYLFMLLIWPYPDLHFVTRFIYPLLPVFLFYIGISVWFLIKSSSKPLYMTIYAFYLFMIVFLIFPATSQFIGRAYASVEEKLLPYRRSREWLLAGTLDDAREQAIKARGLILALNDIRKYISENECLYAFQTPLVMLHSRRITGVLPLPLSTEEEFRAGTMACKYIVSMYLTDHQRKYPAFYPMQRIKDDDLYQLIPYSPEWQGYDEPVLYLMERI